MVELHGVMLLGSCNDCPNEQRGGGATHGGHLWWLASDGEGGDGKSVALCGSVILGCEAL